MIPRVFEYYNPGTTQEALRLLSNFSDVKVLAGGQSLLPLLKLRLASPAALIDISAIKELSYIKEVTEFLSIGACTTHDTLDQNPIVKEKFPALSDALSKLGDQQVRNRGTLGGSACHADPSADLPVVLSALNASFFIESQSNQRVVGAHDFFIDVFTTSVEPEELLTEIRIPYVPESAATAYMKHSLRDSDFPIANVCVLLEANGSKCTNARIFAGVVGPKPVEMTKAEQYIMGKELTEENISKASDLVGKDAEPEGDMHADSEFRLHSLKILTDRTLKIALQRIIQKQGGL